MFSEILTTGCFYTEGLQLLTLLDAHSTAGSTPSANGTQIQSI